MTALRSHPHLMLHEHIEQVQQATEAILQRHSETLYSECRFATMQLTATLHDVGKSTPMFQEYIRDTAHYVGPPELKSHTPLSLLFTLWVGQKSGWDPLNTLAMALAVRGHHGHLPTLPSARTNEPVESTDLDQFGSSASTRNLETQIAELDLDAMATELPVSFSTDALRADWGSPRLAIRRASQYLARDLLRSWNDQDVDRKLAFRLETQLIYSVLLEADKALLAIKDPALYLENASHLWSPAWVDQQIQADTQTSSQTDIVRAETRISVMNSLKVSGHSSSLFSLSAPTGIGKTLLAASWALTLREQMQSSANPYRPQIIVVLPYLSIIDQTVDVYQRLLNAAMTDIDKSWLLPSHSLSDRAYSHGLEDSEESFFIDTWRSDLVITTYDQFLMAVFDDHGRYQMRFHHVLDALIILDEVQSLPNRLWLPLGRAFEQISAMSDTKILLMSATLPSILPAAVPLLPDYPKVFRAFARYQLIINLQTQSLEDFIGVLLARLPLWVEECARVLITLNTRVSARMVFDAIREQINDPDSIPLFFITADVTPKDRRVKIKAIKDNKPCIVVSTQTVEAGVDIDMSMVIRDFAPWDSLVQIAGRCNREGGRPRSKVEIVHLVNSEGRSYAEQIYDPVRLKLTRDIISSDTTIPEEETLTRSQSFFDGLAKSRDTGADYLTQYINFRPREAVHDILRGKNRLQYTFLVLQQDPELEAAMQAAQAIPERWERREAWRRLASRLASISIQVWASPRFSPRQIANPSFGDLWILRDGYYSAESGLDVQGQTSIL
ncbi:MAG: CRISPR-associated helicase Cas3' [Firmicutes bacterium]|nr:CRISPR-associated helicase Cas3' [Bacillota bacterium]MCL5065559.1 CRISPR-associated helicase Cas3' [Bacillota bacterium]